MTITTTLSDPPHGDDPVQIVTLAATNRRTITT